MKMAVVVMLLFTASCHGNEEYVHTYRLYYLPGATGLFMYIEENGVKKNFNFDRERSSSLVLEGWDNLRWNVLYPNSRGKIEITGILDENDKLFVLRKWVIGSPFTVWELENPDDMPQNAVPIAETKLTCSHFENSCPENLDEYMKNK
jgi:hypothetical protein